MAWIVRKSDITWYDSLLWLAVVTLGLSGLDRSGLLAEALPHVPGLNFEWADPTDCRQPDTYGACYIGGLYRVIIWGWRLYGIILIIALLALAGRAAMRRGRPWDLSLAPIAASITMVIIQFMMWTTIVVTLLYSMLNRAEVNGDLMGARSGILDILQQKRVDKDSAAFKFFQFPEMKLDWIERFKFVYAMTVLAVILATFVALLLVRQRRKQARTAGADKQAAARNMPRVLFSPVLMGTLITVFLGLVGLILFQWWFDGFKEFEKARKAFLPFAAVFALILPIIIGNRFSNVVHIARDMIDHQYNLRIESMSWFFPWLFRNQPVLQRRSKIQARLVRVVDSLLKEKKFDDLIFVAHSQGSVIAFDYLRNLKDRESALKGARIQVFTFGSPLGHVFQKYFHEYAPADPMWRSVAGRVDRWINLYRIDDPIGADIQLSAGEAILLRDGGAIENIAMPELGGHQKYWTDMYLAAALHALIVKGSVADTVKAYASEPPRTMPPLWPPPEHAIKAP